MRGNMDDPGECTEARYLISGQYAVNASILEWKNKLQGSTEDEKKVCDNLEKYQKHTIQKVSSTKLVS